MCGIAGITGSSDPDILTKLDQMVSILRHRGPDEQNIVHLSGASLGHTRLSIIDLGLGKQPMSSADGRYHITYNGEIYNFHELRAELESAGWSFRTHSDTEVLLNLFLHEGEKALARLNGMFAFAIWDSDQKVLIAARDRMGKKPFYYAHVFEGCLAFASEPKALLESGLVRGRLDPAALDAFLTLGYIPPNRSAYSNIHILPPAHIMVWRKNRLTVRRYWAPKLEPNDLIDEVDATNELHRLVTKAVQYRMIADVPVGAFLSGGLDSSTVVSLMMRDAERPIKTFSVGFGGLINELPYARAVAEQEGTEHYEIQMDLPVADLLDKMSDIYDEPFADSSNIPTYVVSRFASKQLKVVLTGDGVDEMLAGYDYWYRPLAQSQRASNSAIFYTLLRFICKASAIGLSLGLPLEKTNVHLWRTRQLIDLARDNPDMWHRHIKGITRFPGNLRQGLMHRFPEPDEKFSPEVPECLQGIDRAFWFDISQYLAGDILTKVDRAAMAVGLETRCPMLDPELVSFCLTLPARLKIHDDQGKYIFKEAFRYLWPTALHNRRKRGFGAPEVAWLHRQDVRNHVQDVLLDTGSLLHNLLDAKKLQWGVEGFYNKTGGFTGSQVWTVLSLGLWLKRWSPYLETI